MDGASSRHRSARSSRYPKSVVCITAISGGQRKYQDQSSRHRLTPVAPIILPDRSGWPRESCRHRARPAPGDADFGPHTSLQRLEPPDTHGRPSSERTGFWRRTGRQHTIPVDDAALRRRVAAVAAEFRTTLKQGGPPARRLMQRVLNGRRVPCEPFREPGRRGYRFREEKIPYSAVMSNDIGGPNGIRTRVSALRGHSLRT